MAVLGILHLAVTALLHDLAIQSEDGPVTRETLAQQCPDALDHVLNQLCQRDLIEAVAGGYCFQVALIRRWFAHVYA